MPRKKPSKDKSPPTIQGETPFQKFERLAKALVAVPKEATSATKDLPPQASS